MGCRYNGWGEGSRLLPLPKGLGWEGTGENQKTAERAGRDQRGQFDRVQPPLLVVSTPQNGPNAPLDSIFGSWPPL